MNPGSKFYPRQGEKMQTITGSKCYPRHREHRQKNIRRKRRQILMLHCCCDGLTDHFKNPFVSFTSYASAVLGPPDGLELLGASAGASAGLDADADPLGASELDVEELAPSVKGATATAARRITMSTRARAMAESLDV